MPIFSKLIGPKTVPGESSDVYARGRMDFESNSVVAKIPNFVDLGLSPANTTDKLKSVIGPTTIIEGLKGGSDWIDFRHDCEEVTVGRVSKAKAFRDYIKNNEFETMKCFEWENISVTRPTSENIFVTQPTLEIFL